MLELAADGAWPSAKKPQRRYYSGKNSTKWKAREIESMAPTEWTEVTIDLWQESGDFALTGIAPTALGGNVQFDRIELLRTVEGAR